VKSVKIFIVFLAVFFCLSTGSFVYSQDDGMVETPLVVDPKVVVPEIVTDIEEAINHINFRKNPSGFSVDIALSNIDIAIEKATQVSSSFTDNKKVTKKINKGLSHLNNAKAFLLELSGVSVENLGSSKKRVRKAKKQLGKALRLTKKLDKFVQRQ